MTWITGCSNFEGAALASGAMERNVSSRPLARQRGLCGLAIGPEVNEAFAQAAAVIPGRDPNQAGRIDRGIDRASRRGRQAFQVMSVNNDLHDRADSLGQSALGAELFSQSRTEFGVRAGNRERIAAAGLRAAGRNP